MLVTEEKSITNIKSQGKKVCAGRGENFVRVAFMDKDK